MPIRLVESFDRQVDAGADRAAEIAAVAVDHVEGGGGAKIHHDQRTAEAAMPGERVQQPVGANLVGGIDADLEAPIE